MSIDPPQVQDIDAYNNQPMVEDVKLFAFFNKPKSSTKFNFRHHENLSVGELSTTCPYCPTARTSFPLQTARVSIIKDTMAEGNQGSNDM